MVGFNEKKYHAQSALQAGAKITLLVTRENYKASYKKSFHQVFVAKDIYDWLEIKSLLLEMGKIDAVLTRYEKYVSVVGAINEHLGLNGINYQISRNFCNKFLMKQRWLKHKTPCAAGICLSNLDKLDDFLAKHSFPLILKKTSAAHSNFVVKVDSKKDLLEKLDFFKHNADGYITSMPVKGFKPSVKECHFLLEEMLTGRELTVDTFVSKGKFVHTPICEYVLANQLGINDTYLPIRTMATNLSAKQAQKIQRTVEQAISALAAKNCVCHTELFFDEQDDSCVLIESTPRGGGNRSEMTRITTGYDYNLAVFQATANLEVAQVPNPKKAVSVVEYFAEKNGELAELNLDFLKENPAVSKLRVNCKIGQAVEQAKFGGKTILSFFVEADNCLASQQLAINLFNQLKKNIKVN